MKIFNSIKWRLQIWYGLILVAVLAGFGFTAHQIDCNRQFQQIHNELEQRFGTVANALHGRPRREINSTEPPFDGPPPEQEFNDNPPARDLRQQKFELPPQAQGLFDAS